MLSLFVRFVTLVIFVSWKVVMRFWSFSGGMGYEILGLVWGGRGAFVMMVLFPQLRLTG